MLQKIRYLVQPKKNRKNARIQALTRQLILSIYLKKYLLHHKITSLLTLIGCHFGQGWHTCKLQDCFLACSLKKFVSQKGVTILSIKLLLKMGYLDPFLRDTFFQMAWYKINNGAIYSCVNQPFPK